MPIPKYDEMYRAFLDCLADGQTHRSKEVKDIVAGVFSVSEKERAELLPSGKQQLFDNRRPVSCSFCETGRYGTHRRSSQRSRLV